MRDQNTAPAPCPTCRAPKTDRVNAAGFGPPVIVCGRCGHHFEGETNVEG